MSRDMNIERYDIFVEAGEPLAVEGEGGEYVLYEDHQKIMEQLNRKYKKLEKRFDEYASKASKWGSF